MTLNIKTINIKTLNIKTQNNNIKTKHNDTQQMTLLITTLSKISML
jgi:hypothetical protein